MSEKQGKNGNRSASRTNGIRDEAGRFLPGNPGGPGNPQARTVMKLRRALLNAVTPEQVAKGINQVRTIAENPKVSAGTRLKAWALFFERTLGRPDQKIDLETEMNDDQVRESVAKILSLPGVRRALEAG